jgi:hypothetical protein
MISRSSFGNRTRILVMVCVAYLIGTSPALAAGSALRFGKQQPSANAPVISGTPSTSAAVGRSYDFLPAASDVDGDSLSFSATNVPRWASFSRKTGQLTGMPATRDVGTSRAITITVSDGKRTASLPTFTITVSQGGAPTIGGSPATSVRETELYGFQPSANDPDGDRLSFSITGKPGWATFTASTGLLSGIPPKGAAGTYANITISVSDGSYTRSLAPFSITVAAAANQAPTISGVPATSVNSGQAYSFRPTASDPDGQTLTFSVSSKPAWASFNTATGALSGTPTLAQAGTYSNIVVAVSDGQASASLTPFSINVAATNQAPTISGEPATSVNSGQA